METFLVNKQISYFFALIRFLSLIKFMSVNLKLINPMSMNFKLINFMSINFVNKQIITFFHLNVFNAFF